MANRRWMPTTIVMQHIQQIVTRCAVTPVNIDTLLNILSLALLLLAAVIVLIHSAVGECASVKANAVDTAGRQRLVAFDIRSPGGRPGPSY